MIEEVGTDLLGHVLDTGQYAGGPGASGVTEDNQTQFDLYRSIEQTAPLAVHVRAKLYYGRPGPDGKEATIDYDRVFAILRRVKYNGFISLVYEGREDPSSAVPRGLKFLRSCIEREHASG
jgi:sugar phosphate isomerase/epimerase